MNETNPAIENETNPAIENETNPAIENKVLLNGYSSDIQPSLASKSGSESEECGCKRSVNDVSSVYVYAIGRVGYVYPNESVRNEVSQARYRAGIPFDMSDSDGLSSLLSKDNKPEYYYLASKLCWIFTLGRLETFILAPTSAILLDNLINTITSPSRDLSKQLIEEPSIDLIVGKKGPLSPPGMCGNLVLPIVGVDQVSTYKVKDIIKTIKEKWNKDLGMPKEKFEGYIDNIFSKMIEAADNEGAMDEQRAVNYLVIRAISIYIESARLQDRSLKLEDITPTPVKNVGTRKIVEVVFIFRSEAPGGLMERYSIKVDTTGEFPYIVSGFTPYYSV